jgi:ferrous iron transport protein B
MPVVATVGIRKGGAQELLQWLDGWRSGAGPRGAGPALAARTAWSRCCAPSRRCAASCAWPVHEPASLRLDDAIDRVVLHPLWGMLLLAATMFLMFQAVFSWAAVPMDCHQGRAEALGQWVHARLPDGALRSLLVDGILAGVGGVLVFLPQILILFCSSWRSKTRATCRARPFCWTASWARWGCRAARSFRCCPALPAPCRASWPRAPSPTGASGWSPS